MDLLNFIEIKTNSGYREFELYSGDITDTGFPVDLIAISAFKNSYLPLPGTVIGAFYDKGININQLADNPLLDLRNCFGTWVSKEKEGEKFKNLVCLEIHGTGFGFDEAITNLFATLAVLEIKGHKNKSIAIPLLGSGNQRFDSKTVISTLVNKALDFLLHARSLQKVVFVVRDKTQAKDLNEAMDAELGRNNVRVPRGPVIDGLKSEISRQLESLAKFNIKGQTFHDLQRIISSDCRSFELGVIARKALEFIIYDISNDSRQHHDLFKKIQSLSSLGVARWVQSYMHVLKEFGNESAHNTLSENRNPESISAKDLEVCLFCLQRVLDFYYSFKTKKLAGQV